MNSSLKTALVSLFLGCTLVARCGGFTNAPGTKFTSNELIEVTLAASNSLKALQQHIDDSNFQLMGFSSVNEAKNATNGEPLLVFTVPYSRLTNYQAGADFGSLLESPSGTPLIPDVIIPIMVGTNVRSSSTLRIERAATGGQGAWSEADWGHPQVIRNLIATAGTISDLHPDSVPFVVRLQIPRIWLIGYPNNANQVVFKATADIRLGAVSINKNEFVPQPAMQQWASEARRYNPSLPH